MEWLHEHFPNLRVADESTFERYEFPPEVCEWIKTTWTLDGETYTKPVEQLNQTAAHVLRKKGFDAAANHMMTVSGGDYARMRMDFG